MAKIQDVMNDLAKKLIENHKLANGPVSSTVQLTSEAVDYAMVFCATILPRDQVDELQALLDKTAKEFVEKTFGKPFEFQEDFEVVDNKKSN